MSIKEMIQINDFESCNIDCIKPVIGYIPGVDDSQEDDDWRCF